MIVALAVAAAGVPSVAEMKWQRRVLVVAAPSGGDPALAAQRNALRGWPRGAEDRDVQVVEVIGDRVTGARDAATALRARLRLPATRFALVLIGKDGHVALRSGEPVLAETLQGRIDAMPMRRAGQR
ncbi:DUF4174 domain-containing protein [Sphingomonas sp. HHU CXW]|uniref:DUF4174 domain-containing protein n=1 Tax=Sphingomonas hominis TaxID=2741495 RepID=A0ABX2JI99_9SPHN|nr:DUF4174 domain-containing protein [Sphingomonas hominis]NTS63628.1 DUF4174 domain-containing protein [Sphingomonas hominis]